MKGLDDGRYMSIISTTSSNGNNLMEQREAHNNLSIETVQEDDLEDGSESWSPLERSMGSPEYTAGSARASGVDLIAQSRYYYPLPPSSYSGASST